MSLAALAFQAALSLAAGGVLDVGGAVEARGTQAADPDGDGPAEGLQTGTIMARPSISGALETDGGAVSLGYSPQLSLVTPGDDLFLVLHTADARGEARLSPRVRVRAALVGSIGDLDPASAQGALQGSRGLLDPLAALPYASAGGSVGLASALTHKLTLDLNAHVDFATSLGDDTIPRTTSPGGEAILSYQLTRLDAVLVGLTGQAADVEARGYFAGGGPLVGYRRQLAAQTGIEATAGFGAFLADDDAEAATLLLYPSGSLRISSVLDLAGEAALEAGLATQLAIISDPLGTLAENRASVAGSAGLRITRDVALRGELGAFGPLASYGKSDLPVAELTVALRGAIAWALGDAVAVEAGVLGTSRVINKEPFNDVAVSLSLTGHAPVWHTGGRPRGTDQRPGRTVGVAPIGQAPPLGTTTIEEPEPLEEPTEVPEEPPPELQLPAPAVSPTAEPPVTLPRRAPPKGAKKKSLDDDKEDSDLSVPGSRRYELRSGEDADDDKDEKSDKKEKSDKSGKGDKKKDAPR